MKHLIKSAVIAVTAVTAFLLCASCQTKPAHEHNFEEISRTGSCTEDGVIRYACACGTTREEPTPPAEHDMKVLLCTEPTCTDDGETVSACSVCGYRVTEISEATGHTLSKTRTEPTCTTAGQVTSICSACTYQAVKTVEALGHSLTASRTEPTCTSVGKVTETCSRCSYESTDILSLTDHDYREAARIPASCTEPESIRYICTMCTKASDKQVGEALGHMLDETFSGDLSYLQPCIREDCSYGVLQSRTLENMQAFIQKIRYTGIDDAQTEGIDACYNQMLSILDEAGAYDASLHAYDETSALYEINKTFEAYFSEYEQRYDEIYGLVQYASVQKDIITGDRELTDAYLSVVNYSTSLYSLYAGLWQRVYDSALREYFFSDADGWTEALIRETLLSFNGYADPEYVALSARNEEIIAEFLMLDEDQLYFGTELLPLYAELVENNNRIAHIVGGTTEDGAYVYDTYMDYAYDINGREYTPEDAAVIYENVVTYIVPLYEQYYMRWLELSTASEKWTSAQIQTYYATYAAFTEDSYANMLANEFLKRISITCGGETATYYELLQGMLQEGTLILGDYNGAYTQTLTAQDRPIILLGADYRTNETLIHEFGHYVNMYYTDQSVFFTSVDLAETHSQGLEMLYLSHLCSLSTEDTAEVYDFIYVTGIIHYLGTVLDTISIDRFERAVYSDVYVGPYDDIIMADGRISPDEYDLLYDGIMQELCLVEGGYRYWRPVTTISAGYYVSYAVSLLGSLQLLATPEEFEEKAACYTKLISYIDEPNAVEYDTYKEVLQYAGLYSYDDEALFAYLSEQLALPEGDYSLGDAAA